MKPEQINLIARSIFNANQKRDRFVPLRGSDNPTELSDAYKIQDAVYDLLANDGGFGPLAGHKIALTSQAIQQMCGVDQPVYGSIFGSQIHRSGHTVSAGNYVRLGLEFEIAVKIGQDLPSRPSPWDRDSIAPYVEACMPAFELIEDRNADYSLLDAASILTDRCWCAGAVLGDSPINWRELDLADCAAQLIWNGQTIDTGKTGDSMGHPLNGLAWVANHLVERGRTLKAGEIIITGSALKTRVVNTGDKVTYKIAGLGEVTLNISA